MTEPTRLAPLDWVLATTLLGYALALSLAQGLRLERTIAWGALRAFAQLALVGLALGWVLAQRSPWVVVGVLLLMALLAADGARRRVSLAVPRSRRIIFIAIAAAACAVLPLIVLVVLRLDPWWEPAHLVPIGGLLIGSVMTGSSLALDRLVGEVRARRAEVEAAVALGATAPQAARPAVAAAIHAAMIAPINHLMIVGVIQIPGVTTGLILAGQDPALGAGYQLVISYGIVSCVTIGATVTARLAARELFTPRGQLRAELLDAA